VSFDNAATEDELLTVGIIGCGHLGKQLTNVLLKTVPIPAENLQISTRRPESLGEDQGMLDSGCGLHIINKAVLKGAFPAGWPSIINLLVKTTFLHLLYLSLFLGIRYGGEGGCSYSI
jgi:hypothetical protein